MKIEKKVCLAPLTTFRIGGRARYFCRASSVDDLKKAAFFAKEKKLPLLFLGSGSNMLISDEGFDGVVVKMDILGIEFIKRPGHTDVIVKAGEDWDAFVALCVSKGLYGVENLSGIPGTVGAAPVQNIGAYGMELADTLLWVEVFDTKTFTVNKLTPRACKLGYRDSIFKHEGNHLMLTTVAFTLKEKGHLNISYKDVRNYFEQARSVKPTLASVREAILEIRSRKFPDLEIVGTAGSFFKNPLVTKTAYYSLKKKFPELPGFPFGKAKMKLSLAWIIENVSTLKGLRIGEAGVAPHQTLVLCNFGNARASQIKELARQIEKSVYEKMGIVIEPEVRLVD